MAKFKLDVKPTFKTKVQMPIHGGDTVELEFEFKHRTKDEFSAWMKGLDKRADVDVLEDVLVGWNLDDPCTRDSMSLLCQNFVGAPREIVNAYVEELMQARRKN